MLLCHRLIEKSSDLKIIFREMLFGAASWFQYKHEYVHKNIIKMKKLRTKLPTVKVWVVKPQTDNFCKDGLIETSLLWADCTANQLSVLLFLCLVHAPWSVFVICSYYVDKYYWNLYISIDCFTLTLNVISTKHAVVRYQISSDLCCTKQLHAWILRKSHDLN